MSILHDLKEELEKLEDARMPHSAAIVLEIARQTEKMELKRLSPDLVFRLAVQAFLGFTSG